LVFPEHLTRQKIFDFPDFRLDKDFSWLRLREENGTISLTLKKWQGEGVSGMGEIAFGVDSFEEAERLLLAIGMRVKSIQEKKRELWRFENTEFMLDTWPWIPTFLEIEGKTEEDVRTAADQLGFDWEKAKFGGVARIYRLYFDIKHEEIDRCPEVIFVPVPEWLEAKRIGSTDQRK